MKYDKFTIYLYTCIAIFFVLLISVSFYTFGYKLDFKTGKTIQTGGIVIKTPITEVAVYKNGDLTEKNNFINDLITDFIKIENLEPGTYNIEVRKDEYQTWQKNIEVQSGKVKKYDNVIILKNSYETETIFSDFNTSDYEKIWYSDNKKQIIYVDENEEKQELKMIDLNKETEITLLTNSQISITGDIQNVIWIKNSNIIALESVYNNKNTILLVDTESNKTFTLTEHIANIFKEQKGNKDMDIYSDFVIFKDEDSIFKFNYKTKETELILENIKNFDIQDNLIYFLKNGEDEDYIFKKDIYSGYELKYAELPSDFDDSKYFETQEQNGRLIILSDKSLYLIDKDGSSDKIGSNITETYFFQNGKQIIMHNENEIWVYYTEKKISQPEKEKGDKELITRFSGNIKDIYLYKDETHIMYKENDELKFAELDGRDHRNIQIISSEIDGDVFYIRDTNFIYTINNGKIVRIDLSES